MCFSDGAVSDGSCPPRKTIPIAYVLPVMTVPAGMTAAVKCATIGVTITAVVCLIACSCRWSLSAVIICGDLAMITCRYINDRCQLPSSAGTRLWLHVDINERCQLPPSVGTRLVLATASVVSADPFVSPVDRSPPDLSLKRRWMDLLQETAKMLATFEELWASNRSFRQLVVHCLLFRSCLWLLRLLARLPSC